MAVQATMDLTEHRYYKLNKTMMTVIGQWPYQSIRVRRGFLGVLIFLFISLAVPVLLAFFKYRDDRMILLECGIPMLFGTVCVTKFLSFILNSQKTLKLLNRIRTDWQVWARDREAKILHEYAERGRKITIVYTAVNFSSVIVFLTQPIAPKIIDVLLKNGTEPAKFPFPVDYYYLEVEKFYFYVVPYLYVCVCMTTTVSVVCDIMLITYVQHVCSIFAALRHKLQRIGNNETSVEKGETSSPLDRSDIHLTSCIDRHNDAIEYATLIDATYTWIFFFVIGLGMILINVIGIQILMRANDPEATARFLVVALFLLIVFYTWCYISQVLMDHSISISVYIHNSRWYRLSPMIQKVLQLMTMRCSVSCRLTAGPILIMSMRTFGLTVRTTISYFTFVRSINVF